MGYFGVNPMLCDINQRLTDFFSGYGYWVLHVVVFVFIFMTRKVLVIKINTIKVFIGLNKL